MNLAPLPPTGASRDLKEIGPRLKVTKPLTDTVEVYVMWTGTWSVRLKVRNARGLTLEGTLAELLHLNFR